MFCMTIGSCSRCKIVVTKFLSAAIWNAAGQGGEFANFPQSTCFSYTFILSGTRINIKAFDYQ